MKRRKRLVLYISLSTVVMIFILASSTAPTFNFFDTNQYILPKDVVTIRSPSHAMQKKFHPRYYKIAIIEVIEANTDTNLYRHAIDTVRCYANAQNYNFRIIIDNEYMHSCPHKDMFFRRHCVVAHYLNDSVSVDYVLFIDSDIGVVNPMRRIEEFIDTKADIIFYDRFYNWEVMAGSYLVKNTVWAQNFLKGFANYEYRLPNSFHGTDNGAIHAYLAEIILPTGNATDLPFCLWIYNHSKHFDDLFAYESCIRGLLENLADFEAIKILPKGTAWARDNWLTNSKWNAERDFMMHNWKLSQLRTYTTIPLPLKASSQSEWYNPLAGSIELSLCTWRNTTWTYDRNLVAAQKEIDVRLEAFSQEVDKRRAQAMIRVQALRERWIHEKAIESH